MQISTKAIIIPLSCIIDFLQKQVWKKLKHQGCAGFVPSKTQC